jgi:hypothetical protein
VAGLRSAAAAVAITVLLLAVHPGVRGEPPGLYDEGNTVDAAWRVAEGEVLYRDLWTIHAPGSAHLLALVFAVFGSTVVVERALKLALLGLLSALGYACYRRFSSPLAAATSVALGVGAFCHPVLVPADTGLVAILAALLAMAAALDAGLPPTRLLVAGVLLGMTAWFRADFGLYATAACTVVVALSSWLGRRDGSDTWRAMRKLATLGLGVAAPVVAMAAYFWARGALGPLVQQMIVFPATTFAAVRGIPAPALDTVEAGLPFGLLFWLTPPTLVAGAALGALDLRRDVREAHALLLVSLSGLFVFNYARVRADIVHLWPALVLTIPVAVALGARAWRVALDQRRLLLGVSGGLLLAGVATFGVMVVRAVHLVWSAPRSARLFDAIPTKLPGSGVLLDPALEEALLVLDAHVPAGAPVFVGNQRHDRIFMNCSLCYFLLRRPSPTRYYNLHPGVATTAVVQREIVAQLERQRIDWILLWDMTSDPIERQPRGASDLDEYLASRYETAGRYGRWEVRRRIGTRAPATSALGTVVAALDPRPPVKELGETELQRARTEPEVARELGMIQRGVFVQAEERLRAEEGPRAEDGAENTGGKLARPERGVDP